MSDDDEWQFPAPLEDPESRKGGLGRGADVAPRLVPRDNIVEGEMEDGRKSPSGCPFSSP